MKKMLTGALIALALASAPALAKSPSAAAASGHAAPAAGHAAPAAGHTNAAAPTAASPIGGYSPSQGFGKVNGTNGSPAPAVSVSPSSPSPGKMAPVGGHGRAPQLRS